MNCSIYLLLFVLQAGTVAGYCLLRQQLEQPVREGLRSITFQSDSFGITISEIEQMRTYQSFHLTADRTANRRLFLKVRQAIHTIKATKDCIHGVHLVFNGDAPFQDFITATDLFSVEQPKMFVADENDIFAFYFIISFIPESDQRLSYY